MHVVLCKTANSHSRDGKKNKPKKLLYTVFCNTMNYRILHHHLVFNLILHSLSKKQKNNKNRNQKHTKWDWNMTQLCVHFWRCLPIQPICPCAVQKNPRACSSAVHQMLIGWQFGQNWWQSSPGTRVAERKPIKYHMKSSRVSHRPFTPETSSSASTWQQALCADRRAVCSLRPANREPH